MLPEDTSHSLNRSHTPQTSPHASNAPRSFPNSKQETPTSGIQTFRPEQTGRKELGRSRRLSMTAPHKLPHPRPCVRVTHSETPCFLPPLNPVVSETQPQPTHFLPKTPQKKKKKWRD